MNLIDHINNLSEEDLFFKKYEIVVINNAPISSFNPNHHHYRRNIPIKVKLINRKTSEIYHIRDVGDYFRFTDVEPFLDDYSWVEFSEMFLKRAARAVKAEE